MFFDWFRLDDDEEKPSLQDLKLEGGFEAIIIDPSGTVFQIDPTGYLIEIKADHFSLGAGSEMALGAMDFGASAREAVELVCKRVHGCGGKIVELEL